MRTLLGVLGIVVGLAFVSCKDVKTGPKYLDSKLVEGAWCYQYAGDSIVYEFKNGVASNDSYLLIGTDYLKPEGKIEYGKYFLTDTLILFEHSEGTWGYKLSITNPDSLFINNTGIWNGYKRVK
ncbi:MAG: hypothetical protein RIS47_665 [Bacteroidota bacterium]|jgi:hypothetical protein